GSEHELLAQLFSEEAGAVLQVAESRLAAAFAILGQCGLGWVELGRVEHDDALTIYHDDAVLARFDPGALQRTWSETSFRMQALRDNPETAEQEYERILDREDPGLNVCLTFDPDEDVAAPFIGGARPRVAILREQGVNSQLEMAAAFIRAGFEPVDVHMSDVLEGRDELLDYQCLVACGGFSFGDVLGAGGGWAKSILYHARARAAVRSAAARGAAARGSAPRAVAAGAGAARASTRPARPARPAPRPRRARPRTPARRPRRAGWPLGRPRRPLLSLSRALSRGE